MSLVARLADAHAAARGTAAARQAERASVLEHLREICSTRRGTVEGRPDYGIPSVADILHAFPHATGELVASLRHTILVYEPRLGDVRVRALPQGELELALRVEISGVLAGARDERARFEAHVEPSRRVTVR